MIKYFIAICLSVMNVVSIMADDKILITINQFISHPALDQAKLGIEAALSSRNMLPNRINIKFDNAQGSVVNSAGIAKHQAAFLPKFMIAIATPALQSNLKAAKASTVGFIAVSNPEEIITSSTSDRVIGVKDQLPLDELINITAKVLPKIKNVGVIFNNSETNSIKGIESLEIAARKIGINVKKAVINSSTEAKSAALSLVESVDAIYLPLDNTVVSAVAAIMQTCFKANIPVIANDPSLTDSGVLIALGSDYFSNGKQLGNMIADIIEGKALTTNIQPPNNIELKINYQSAAKLHIDISRDFEREYSRAQ